MRHKCTYLRQSLVPHCFVYLEQPGREVVHLDSLGQRLSEKLAVVRHPVHQIVQNELENAKSPA
jgi:hypothetical protein